MKILSNKTAIFWFRRDLRIDNNTGLFHALQNYEKVIPLFIFDDDILNKLDNKSDKRVELIHQMLLEIDEKLKLVGSGLVVKKGNVATIFKQLIQEFKFQAVFTNKDYEPDAIQRDKDVAKMLHDENIDFCSFKDQVIFEENEVLKPDGTPYTVFTPYSKKWKSILLEKNLFSFKSEDLIHKFIKVQHPVFPDLKDIGFNSTGIKFTKPDTNFHIIENYHHNRDFPGRAGTTHLGLHLRFGSISIRKLVKIALKHNETWLNELIWREFFMQILFHFPKVQNYAFKSKYDEIPWRNNELEFQRWCAGQTGYPIVDAGMRELNETGWMHNRVRMVCASFLTKHLLIDWRWGEAYFATKLLDYDLSANNGNWQWASGSGCDAAPYFRIFNPTEQTKKFDAEHEYINKWIPELNSLNYPLPIVPHEFARDRALRVYKSTLTV